MNALHHGPLAGVSRAILLCLFIHAAVPEPARAINIFIDYRYDTNNFFTPNQPARNALQAAADRYSSVVTESLLAASLNNNTQDPRIGFTHPGTGVDNFQVSPALGLGSDALAPSASCPTCYAANEYRGPWSIPANQLIIYVGGRPLSGGTAGEANTGTGLNFSDAFNSSSSHLNRGFRISGGTGYLPVWGGAIAFDNDGTTNWHFNHTTASPGSSTDFYSIAMHEIGHILGLSTGWNEWSSLSSGNQFLGPNTVTTYNADNGTSLSSLTRTGDGHFQDGAYDSYLFQNGLPNLVGTVGTGGKQDLLMEPSANFTGSIRRFELTNTDVAALRDVGWSTIPQITSQPGDYNKNGTVDAADFVVFAKGLADGNYASFRSNFGESTPGGSPANSPHLAPVPEPTSWLFFFMAISAILISRRPPRR